MCDDVYYQRHTARARGTASAEFLACHRLWTFMGSAILARIKHPASLQSVESFDLEDGGLRGKSVQIDDRNILSQYLPARLTIEKSGK